MFTDRAGEELRRCLLAEIAIGSCDLRHIFGRMEWLDDTVRIKQNDDRDYWICAADGGVEFHYPRVERGDPQASTTSAVSTTTAACNISAALRDWL